MNKIYYFFDRESEKCYFFDDQENAWFYRNILGSEQSLEILIIKSYDFEGTDVMTNLTFLDLLKEELEWDDDNKQEIKDYIRKLESKIRNEKLNDLLND